MNDKQAEARARAAETKKRRTREKLIHACDKLMRDDLGWSTTVEAIAAEAGVSTATFYTVFQSRHMLCEYAFKWLVVDELYDAGLDGSFEDRARAIAAACQGRANLIRGALMRRLETSGGWPGPIGQIVETDNGLAVKVRYDGHFVDQVAELLADPGVLEVVQQREEQFLFALRMAALQLLDALATDLTLQAAVGTTDPIDFALLSRVFMWGCGVWG